MSNPVIGYVGMTHLGLNSAAGGAARGFEIVAYDPEQKLVDRLCKHDFPVLEPDLQETIEKHIDGISFTCDAHDLKACDVIYVAPDVATDDNGVSDLGVLRTLLKIAEKNMRPDATLVILSQVPPGFTRQQCREGLSLYYQVETLIFGRAIERAVYPERFIIGCHSPGQPLADAYRVYLEAFDCPILPMRYESAELAKISINFCLVASISVANVLAEVCEGIGADWSEIVPALKLDKRIGQYAYLKPGLGIAGGNLERDLATVIGLAQKHDTDARIVEAWIQNSRHRQQWAARLLQAEIDAGRVAKLGILGLTYKENTHSIKNSPSIATIKSLDGVDIQAFDPMITVNDANLEHIRGCETALDTCDGVDALAVLTPWPVFKELSPKEISARMGGWLVLDPYAVFDEKSIEDAGLEYRSLGVSRPSAAS